MTDQGSMQRLVFRCLENGHTFSEQRDVRAPLVLRQSAWCAQHDAPAVGVGDDRIAAPDVPQTA